MPAQKAPLREVAAAATGAPGAEVARKAPQTLAEQIKAMESQYAMAMPRGAEAGQLIRDGLTCLRNTPKLAECLPGSVLGGLMTCAQLGLRPGVPNIDHAWLIPFYDKHSRALKAQLVIGYKGMIELGHRSEKIQSLIARTVRANDHFDLEYGLEDRLEHRPLLRGERGPSVGYYAVAKFTTGGHAFIYMSREEVEEHRDKYAMARNKAGEIVGPWADPMQFDGMAQKTCVRQLAKWIPKATDLQTAVAADGSVRFDVDPGMSAAEASAPAVPDEDEGIVDGELVDEGTGEIKDPPAEDPGGWPETAQPGSKAP